MEHLIITEEIKKSDMTAHTVLDYKKITQDWFGLIKCSYEETDEGIIFNYDITGLKKIELIYKEDIEKKYAILVNFARLEDLCMKFNCSLNPENLFYDENNILYIKQRDLYPAGKAADKNYFIEVYKAYIAGTLNGKYDIATLLKSGIDFFKDEEEFKAFYNADGVSEVLEELKNRQSKAIKKENDTKMKVSKRMYISLVIFSITFSVLFIVSMVFLILFAFIRNPRQEKINNSLMAYISSDYTTCIHELDGIEIDYMDAEVKYILAVSYAKTENLKKDEISGIVSRLSVHSNERELEYWINLGKMNTEKAEDLAKSLSDDKLLIYAYMKELDMLKNDVSINGSDKQQRIEELESSIKALGEKYSVETDTEDTDTNSNSEGN